VRIVRAALVLAFALGYAASAATGEEARVVTVRVLADEETRALPAWRETVSEAMAAVSSDFERTFGVRLDVLEYGAWTSDDAIGSLDALLDDFEAKADRSGCDVLLAFTAQETRGSSLRGYSLYEEGLILATYSVDRTGLERILEHEWAHMFGAVHVADPASLMDPFIRGTGFDALNADAIRLNRDRSFNGIDFPLPAASRPRAAEVYRAVCEFNRAAPAERTSPVPRPEKAGVSVSHEIRGIIADGGPANTFLLDDAYVLLARIRLEEKDYEEALAACRTALKLNPENLETRDLEGIILRRQGRVDDAIKTYREILEAKPRSPRFLYNLGIAQARAGDTQAALASYRQAVRLKPNFAEACNNIGELGLREGRLDEAEEAFLQALSSNDRFALAHSNLAEVCVRKGDYGRALAEVTAALSLNPYLPGPHNVRGNLYHHQGRMKEAVAEYEAALSLDPVYEKAFYNLGICRFEEGNVPEASRLFSKALELRPGFGEAHASLGYCLLRSRKIDEGIAEIRRAQELGLASAATHVNLSYAYLQKNESGSAIDEARQALAIDPSLAMAQNNLGIALSRQRKFAEAAAAFRKASELDPKYKDALANLGRLDLHLGKLDEALDLLLRAASLDPGDGTLEASLAAAYFEKAAFSKQTEDYEKAWEHAQKAQARGVTVNRDLVDALKKKLGIKSSATASWTSLLPVHGSRAGGRGFSGRE
jgi:tetratricopeptide (TPR) repeat protein